MKYIMFVVISASDSEVKVSATMKSEKEPTVKKQKTESAKSKTKTAANRSRILQICDSSSDEDDAPANGNLANCSSYQPIWLYSVESFFF